MCGGVRSHERALPLSPQNRWPDGLSAPHLGQRFASATPRTSYPPGFRSRNSSTASAYPKDPTGLLSCIILGLAKTTRATVTGP